MANQITEIAGTLRIDTERGVLWFNSSNQCVLRICGFGEDKKPKLKKLLRKKFSGMIDITLVGALGTIEQVSITMRD